MRPPVIRVILQVLVILIAFIAGIWVARQWNAPGALRIEHREQGGQVPAASPSAPRQSSPSPTPRVELSPGPHRVEGIQDRLDSIQEELQSLDSTDEKNQLEALQDDLKEKQDQVETLETELLGQRAGQASALRNEELRRQQESAAAQDTAARLRDEIRAQTERVNSARQTLARTVAPQDSDRMVALRDELAREQAALSDLDSRYADIVDQERAGAQASYARESQLIQEHAAAEQDLRMSYEQAKGELALLQQRAQKLQAEVARRDGAAQQLEAERDLLQDQLSTSGS
jgi:hypothetical protein